MKKERNYNIDVIRIFAFFCVVAVHFFLNSGFYDVPVYGKKMLVMSIFRNFFIICVPLFITMTGYLMCSKSLKNGYYKGLLKILLTYLLCSIVYSVFTCLYYNSSFEFYDFIKNLLSYRGTLYAWYIEMYIGLFVLIPFLNFISSNLNSKKDFQILLASLIFLVSLPGIINIYKIDSIEWWHEPSINSDYFKAIPSYWCSIYPLLYYFLGAYIKKFSSEIKYRNSIFLLIFTVILSGVFSFYRSYNNNFAFASWNDYSSLFTFIITFVTFVLILNIKIDFSKYKFKKVLVVLADSCLGGYLLSCIFDTIFYSKLSVIIPSVVDRFVYAPIIVLCVFICSLFLSIVVRFIQHFLVNFFKFLALIVNK